MSELTNNGLVLLLGLFIIKHFLADYPLQVAKHYTVKGTYGRWGGIEHALIHGVLTAAVLYAFAPIMVVLKMAAIDTVVHYHVDWAKMKLNKHLGYGPTTHEQFWWLLGLDQMLHYLTYLAIIYYL